MRREGGAWGKRRRLGPLGKTSQAPLPALGEEEAVAKAQAFEQRWCTKFPREAPPLALSWTRC